jgi:hypothetical protein
LKTFSEKCEALDYKCEALDYKCEAFIKITRLFEDNFNRIEAFSNYFQKSGGFFH